MQGLLTSTHVCQSCVVSLNGPLESTQGVPMTNTATAIWSVVRGESPTARAIEPGAASIDIPDEILTWAEEHGLSQDDPDVYLLVTPSDEAGEVIGEIAYRELAMPTDDLATVRAALDDE